MPAHDIVINEIMFEPASGNPEWIELQNISKDTVNLKNCTVGDVLSTPHTTVITTKDYSILPGDYVILSSDTLSSFYGYTNSKLIKLSLPALNDDKDGIVLKSSLGATLDSVFYYSSWASKKGYSLERIDAVNATCDSANWCFSYSPDKASPAKTNSAKGFAKLKTRGLLFNEILFNAGSKNSNFIEIYNPADSAISLNGVVINIDKIYKVYLCDTAASIAAHGYYLIAEDSIIIQKYPSLKNFTAKNISASKLKLSKSGSSVSVTDAFGILLDTVAYSSLWQSAGFSSSTDRSIEKKSPATESNLSADWISCMSSEGATPGAENFSNKEVKLSGTGAEFKPNPFSPDNDGFEDFTVITLNAAFNPALVSITIYDNRGRKVRKLCDAVPVTIPAQITYDGMNDDKNPLRMGIYIALIEIQDMNSGRKETIKKVFVVARKLR